MSRRRYYDDYGFAPYVSVGEKRARNRKAAADLQKRNRDIRPVVVEGRSIATSWWGKSWNANLERYADYSNRIGRGRSYVRHGAVLDLRIDAGRIDALVAGSRGSPYEVTVTIDELSASVWKQLREESLRQVESLTDLLAGQFPKALKDTFFAQGTGLFPAPKEVSFDCSCPDWASMCKHVAAVLYGIGNRLDSAPELLFTLRKVTVDDLIAHTVDAATEGLIGKAGQAAGDDVLADADLGDVFGIELDDGAIAAVDLPPPAPEATTRKSRGKSKSAKTKASRRATRQPTPPQAEVRSRGKSAKTTTSPRAASGRKATRKSTTGSTASVKRAGPAEDAPGTGRGKRRAAVGKPRHGQMLDQLLAALGSSRSEFTTAELMARLPGWTRLQVVNTIQRTIQEGTVARVGRGVYRRT